MADVEWKLIEMPLPRLQQIGDELDEFVYRIGWSKDITVSRVRAGDFDNAIRFIGEAGEHLLETVRVTASAGAKAVECDGGAHQPTGF